MSTDTPELDATKALTLLREIVAERPDYVYEGPDNRLVPCVYADEGKPSCLVGHVLARAGFDIDTIAHLDGGGRFSEAARECGLPVTDQAAYLLSKAQSVQDKGQPWREALAAAEWVVVGSVG